MGLRSLCKSAERSKVTLGRRVRERKLEEDDKGNIKAETVVVKSEEMVGEIPINAGVKFDEGLGASGES